MYRHGDLLIEQIKSIPKDAKKKNDNVILHGTATGHSHCLNGGTVLLKDNQVYLRVPKSGGQLAHQEHNTIDLPVGNYSVIRQIEFDPYERVTREVLD